MKDIKFKEKINHKYLKEANIDSPDKSFCDFYGSLFYAFRQRKRYKKEFKNFKKTGVFNPNTWALDYFLYAWLYENLCAYVDCCCVDLEYHKFKYKDKEYNQKEMIDMLKSKIKEMLADNDYFAPDYFDKRREVEKEVVDIWYLISPSMWW